MAKSILALLLVCLSIKSFSQANQPKQKQFRIASGFGIASRTKNVKSPGTDTWVQFDYRVLEKFSIVSEFENMNYKIPGYYVNFPVDPNEIKINESNFSLLIKYHFDPVKQIQFSFASGWTYNIQQVDYYILEQSGNSQSFFRNVTSSSDYGIPLLGEVAYPLLKNINLEGRIKYNLNPEGRNTYAFGLGFSLRL